MLKKFIEISKPKQIDLIIFSDEISKTETFSDADVLYNRLGNMKYDGRSDVSSLNKIEGSWDKMLIFSDGISSLNEKNIPFVTIYVMI